MPDAKQIKKYAWLALGCLIAVIVGLYLEVYRPPKADWMGALHLIVPLLVLVVEIFMLAQIYEEHKERNAERDQRKRVMEDLNTFRISLGRGNYMHEIERAISGAENAVVFTSATMQTSWSSDHQARVVAAVKERKKALPSYTHRGIVAKRAEALPGTVELLCTTHVEVRLSDIMLMSRLRFVVRDYDFSVIGVAEGEPSLEHQPETQRSFSVESTMLATALRAKFEELWNAAIDPWTYLNDLISSAQASHPKYSRKEACELLGLDDVRQKLYSPQLEMQCPAFKALP